jgi:hypothetical protein
MVLLRRKFLWVGLLLTLCASCTPPSPSNSSAEPTPKPTLSRSTKVAVEETIYETTGQAGVCIQPEERVVAPIEGTPLDEQVITIARAVEILRDLEFKKEPKTHLLSEEAFTEKSRSLVTNSYTPEQAKIDERVLIYLGLLPPGTDLLELSEEVAGEQIGGFYLPRTKQLYVPREGENLTPYDEIVVAHELDHALADAALDFPKLNNKDLEKADEVTAGRALVEGDATLLMQQYGAAAFTPEDAAELLADPAIGESLEDTEDVPFVLRRSLEFPYDEGLRFACRLFSKGGWKAIDRAYASPPISTAQVLLPELYDRGSEPVSPPKISAPSESWRRSTTSSFGMFDLSLLLQAPGGESVMSPEDALERARGWRGGAMSAWTRGKKVALAISVATVKEPGGTSPLCDHLKEWFQDSFSGVDQVADDEFRSDDRYAVIECDSDAAIIAMAPTRKNAAALLPDSG